MCECATIKQWLLLWLSSCLSVGTEGWTLVMGPRGWTWWLAHLKWLIGDHKVPREMLLTIFALCRCLAVLLLLLLVIQLNGKWGGMEEGKRRAEADGKELRWMIMIRCGSGNCIASSLFQVVFCFPSTSRRRMNLRSDGRDGGGGGRCVFHSSSIERSSFSIRMATLFAGRLATRRWITWRVCPLRFNDLH